MPSTALQTRISAFESLAGGSTTHSNLNTSPPSSPTQPKPESLIDAPLSAATAAALPPVAHFSTTSTQRNGLSPSPSPPNLGRKTSLIDLTDWIVDDDPVLTAPRLTGAPTLKPKPVIVKRASMTALADGRTPTQRAFAPKATTPLINLSESPPKLKGKLGNGMVSPPPLPPRKASYTSLKSVASSSSSQSSGPSKNGGFLYPPQRGDSLTVENLHHGYPPSPLTSDRSKHAPTSSISSFHSISLGSDTEPATPNSLSDFIATYPGDRRSDTDSVSLAESYEDVSTSSLASPATERMISLDFERARARQSSTVPPTLPQRPSSTFTVSSARSSMKSPPPAPPLRPAHFRASGSSTPRSSPGSPIINPINTNLANANYQIPTTYAVRRPPPPPPSRASDRSSVQSTFSIASSSNHTTLSRTGTITSITSMSSTNSSSPKAAKVKRPTPVPVAARQRYEAVFNGNVIQKRRAEKRQRKLALMKLQGNDEKSTNGLLTPNDFRGRRAAGWRGLSVDLITGDPNSVIQQLEQQKQKQEAAEEEELKVDEHIDKDERLEGAIIRHIWKCSGLDKKRLAEIWAECDPSQTGSLDLDSFVKGMWRIDEELRRNQAQLVKSASSASLASLASKHSSLSSRPSSLRNGRTGPVSSYRPPRILR